MSFGFENCPTIEYLHVAVKRWRLHKTRTDSYYRKILARKGLRRAAIIVSRVGADDGAIAMSQGAMREHGKLMLVLDDDKICQMLQMKERGEDPTDLLFDVADHFLLSLPR